MSETSAKEKYYCYLCSYCGSLKDGEPAYATEGECFCSAGCMENFLLFGSMYGRKNKQKDPPLAYVCHNCGRHSYDWEKDKYIKYKDLLFCSAECVKAHINRERERKREPQHKCGECGKTFSEKGGSRYTFVRSRFHGQKGTVDEEIRFCSDACYNNYVARNKNRSRQEGYRREYYSWAEYEQRFYHDFFGGRQQHKTSSPSRGSSTSEPIPQDIWNFLIKNCHPDRHENSELSNKVTRWLLERKPN